MLFAFYVVSFLKPGEPYISQEYLLACHCLFKEAHENFNLLVLCVQPDLMGNKTILRGGDFV